MQATCIRSRLRLELGHKFQLTHIHSPENLLKRSGTLSQNELEIGSNQTRCISVRRLMILTRSDSGYDPEKDFLVLAES